MCYFVFSIFFLNGGHRTPIDAALYFDSDGVSYPGHVLYKIVLNVINFLVKISEKTPKFPKKNTKISEKTPKFPKKTPKFPKKNTKISEKTPKFPKKHQHFLKNTKISRKKSIVLKKVYLLRDLSLDRSRRSLFFRSESRLDADAPNDFSSIPCKQSCRDDIIAFARTFFDTYGITSVTEISHEVQWVKRTCPKI